MTRQSYTQILPILCEKSCEILIYIPIAIFYIFRECCISTYNKCKECSIMIEQNIADSECSCCRFSTPADLNSRIQKVYLPEKTRLDSVKSEISDLEYYNK